MSELLQVLSQPWAIEPGTLSAICDVIERGTSSAVTDLAARAQRRARAGRGAYHVSDGVADIPVSGVIAKQVSIFDFLFGDGGTATATIRAQLQAALADEDVHTILLDIDSPGGTVAGVPELADEIAAAAEHKRVVAFTDGMMASAAYWLGASASEVVSSKAAQVGSIGVYAALTDQHVAAHQAGVKREVVKYGRYKGGGIPGTPIDSDTRQQVQEQVNTFGEMFDAHVAARRGFDGEQMSSAGEGRLFIGAKALEVGLTDAVSTYEELRRQLSTNGGSTMSKDTKAALATDVSAVAPELIKAIQTDAITEFTAELAKLEQPKAEPVIDEKAIETAVTDAIAKDRDRAGAIASASFEGQAALVARLIDKGVGAEEAADLLAADRRRRAVGSSPVSTAAIEPDNSEASLTDEEKWGAEWTRHHADEGHVAASFSTPDLYIVWKQGERAGAFRSA